jgi:hypothetical protein
MVDHLELYLREIGYGMLDLATCGEAPDDGAGAAGALEAALVRQLAERGVA